MAMVRFPIERRSREGLMFVLGRLYTARDINRQVGGSLQSYLPHRDGRILAARLDPKLNPDAPDIVLPGTGPVIEGAARLFLRQKDAVPTFVKQSPGEFE